MGHTWPLFRLFLYFQTNIKIHTTNKCAKCPSSKRCWDSNSQTLEHESTPITTRPGILPEVSFTFKFDCVRQIEHFVLISIGTETRYFFSVSCCVSGNRKYKVPN